MIEIKNLTKVYKLNKKQMKESKTKSNRKVAVDHLSLNAHKGEIYGLLGPNGAGKTTTLRCIATIIKPTEGEVKVAGHDVVTEAEQVRKSIGFLTSDIKLDPQFTPDYMFEFFGRLHGVSKEVLKERKEQLFEYFGIKDFAHKQIKYQIHHTPKPPAVTKINHFFLSQFTQPHLFSLTHLLFSICRFPLCCHHFFTFKCFYNNTHKQETDCKCHRHRHPILCHCHLMT